jgi:4-diphosphocytidyl-2-C-methyl-D-erythritol kinase
MWGVEMRARCTGSVWEVFAPAKLNLYLEILGRRDDGFHELETLMTPIRIYDQLQWSPSAPGESRSFSLAYHPGTPAEIQRAAPADEANLAWKAFDLIGRTAGVEPTGRATLVKRIPVQAGMGGASSDAAAALVLANGAWGIHYSPARLGGLAAELGSDVPFFLADGPALCLGRGERVTPIRGLPSLHFVIAKPAEGVSTAAAFGSLQAGAVSGSAARDSRAAAENLVDNLKRGALAQAAGRMVNRLQQAAAAICPSIARLQRAFAHTDCLAHMMTGSGSAYFGVTRSARQAVRVARQIAAMSGSRLGSAGVESPATNVFAAASC